MDANLIELSSASLIKTDNKPIPIVLPDFVHFELLRSAFTDAICYNISLKNDKTAKDYNELRHLIEYNYHYENVVLLDDFKKLIIIKRSKL